MAFVSLKITNNGSKKIALSISKRNEFRKRSRSFTAPHYEVLRAKVIILLEKGLNNCEVGRKVGLSRRVVKKWKKQFLADPDSNLRPERKRKTGFLRKEENVALILKEMPSSFGIEEDAWTIASIVQAYFQRHGERITRSSSWRISRDLGYRFIRNKETKSPSSSVKIPRNFLSESERFDLENISRKWSLSYRKVIWAKTYYSQT